MENQFAVQGSRLRNLRKSRGLTQKELADKIGCTEQTCRNWESGKNLPETDCLLLLSDLYGVSCDYLLCRIDEKNHDLQFIHDETGLSEAAVTVLQYANSAANKKSVITLKNQRIISLINIALDREGKEIEKGKGKQRILNDLFTLLYDYAFADNKGVRVSPETISFSYDLSLDSIEYDTLPLLREAIIAEIRKELDSFKGTKKQGKKPC